MPLSRADFAHADVSPHAAFPTGPDRTRIANRYQHLRVIHCRLTVPLTAHIPFDVFAAGAQQLGLTRGRETYRHGESEQSILADFCIYTLRTNGRTVLDNYLLEQPFPDHSEEAYLLRVMQQSFFSVFRVEDNSPGFGVIVRDLVSDSTRLLLDRGLSLTAYPGCVFASRLLPIDDWVMTTGAAVPVVDNMEGAAQLVRKLLKSATDPATGELRSARVIRDCLQRGMTERVYYLSHEETIPQPGVPAKPGAKLRRNDPCPCGSGRKYKHCCLRMY